jgi:hypothetical protein
MKTIAAKNIEWKSAVIDLLPSGTSTGILSGSGGTPLCIA